MDTPFTINQFFGVFRDYNQVVCPAQLVHVALALAALGLVLQPKPWSGTGVSAILMSLWAWTAIAYHLSFFTRISAAAYAFAAVSMVVSLVFMVHNADNKQIASATAHIWRAFRLYRSPVHNHSGAAR